MNKRYQVFVSSTYADLKDERQRVIQTLMEMDCIPSGMELFPAADEEQFEFIKKIIDDCDYYLLIVGGRYGSTTEEGVSYTEKEYDYAIEKGIKVIAFLHQEPNEIPVGKTDKNPDLAGRLEVFRRKVQTNRLIKYWNFPADLPGLVSLSLTKTIKTHPAVGWIRGNSLAMPEMLAELLSVRALNADLQTKLSALTLTVPKSIANIAGLDEKFELHGVRQSTHDERQYAWNVTRTFGEIFAFLAPYLLAHPTDVSVSIKLGHISVQPDQKYYNSSVDDQLFQTVKLQLKALGLVALERIETTRGIVLRWSLTDLGEQTMTELRAIRKNDQPVISADVN